MGSLLEEKCGRRAVMSLMAGVFAAAGLMAMPAEAQENPDVVWKLSHTTDPNSIYQTAAVAFKEYVEEKTGGHFKIHIFHSSQLGWEREVLEALQVGTIESTIPALGPLATFVPAYDVFNLPFIFESPEHMIASFELPGMEKLKDVASEKDLVVAKHFLPTFRYPMNSKRPIETPEDLAGLKVRTMGVPAHVDAYTALGANVTSMAFSEVYGALQLGAVDGVENFYTNLYTMKFQEQAKYISDIPVVNNAAAMVFSKKAFEKLPKNYQEIVLKAADVAGDAANEVAVAEEAKSLQLLQEAGVNYTHVEDLKPFKDLTAPVSQKYVSQMEPWVAELREEIVTLVED
ncbi:TRAP transporter substrate-binding protein [Nitratireductor sp. ZSWI3]|uniref:TRAP transporter substrate-binding protein n=1 Tax=Nitratireductor sp. ZSWI3 TaxID=2966359 RepID=UPI00214FDB04|nr:TRAP transporter substrate-binding protein [Nitratireductor sp. ZSWI3]MCR4265202.1 TRAP transporter substrate-binding protein [Nitratireductor sp. ZSWI3]